MAKRKTRVFCGGLHYNQNAAGQFVYEDAFELKHNCISIYHLKTAETGRVTQKNIGYICYDEGQYNFILDRCLSHLGCMNSDELKFDTFEEAMEVAWETFAKYKKGKPYIL